MHLGLFIYQKQTETKCSLGKKEFKNILFLNWRRQYRTVEGNVELHKVKDCNDDCKNKEIIKGKNLGILNPVLK